jgi:hypothetical protein
MAFEKGKSGNPSGRPVGSENKTSIAAKQAFQLAFDKLGGHEALATWAAENPTDFYKLFSKLIPQDTNVNLSTHEEALKALG